MNASDVRELALRLAEILAALRAISQTLQSTRVENLAVLNELAARLPKAAP